MTDTPQWPITSDSSDEFVERRRATPSTYHDFFANELYDFPPLVFPRPLVDKALLARDDDKEEL